MSRGKPAVLIAVVVCLGALAPLEAADPGRQDAGSDTSGTKFPSAVTAGGSGEFSFPWPPECTGRCLPSLPPTGGTDSPRPLAQLLGSLALGLVLGMVGGWQLSRRTGAARGVPNSGVIAEIAAAHPSSLASVLSAVGKIGERLDRDLPQRPSGVEDPRPAAGARIERALAEQTKKLEELASSYSRLLEERRGGAIESELCRVGERLAEVERLLRPGRNSQDIAGAGVARAPAASSPLPPPPPASASPAAAEVAPVVAPRSSAGADEAVAGAPPLDSEATGRKVVLDGLRGLWSELGSGADLASATPGLGSGEAYLARLSVLEERARQRLARKDWDVHLAHLRLVSGVSVERPGLSPHPIVEVHYSPRESPVQCSCGEKLSSLLLFQLVLQLDPPGSAFFAITLPPGPFSASNFPAAYQRLLRGPLPTGQARIERIEQPAILRRSATAPDLYELVAPLEVVFA